MGVVRGCSSGVWLFSNSRHCDNFDRCSCMCRAQYPSEHQQQLISNLASLTSSGNTTLPLLLQADAFLSDIFALGLAGVVEPSSMLRAAAAVAASPAAAQGFGLHLLVLPAIEALQQLSFYTYVSSLSCTCVELLYVHQMCYWTVLSKGPCGG